jgi:succinate dehydrogenase / fumarate reductase, cytochrome b subunit
MSSWTDPRPMSPHVSIWRWHITMLGSILHRVTGMALYGGAAIAVAWLFVMTFGEERYDQFAALAGSIWGQVILFGLLWSAVYHALNGVRHLVWDAGHGFKPKTADFTGWLVLLLSIAGTAGIWLLAGLVPGFDPLGLWGTPQ